MSVLIGHPTGTPFAHHAALAHFETGVLESFCVPWMPSAATLRLLASIGPLEPMVRRLSRRHFPPLANAPKTQGRIAEMRRLLLRAWGRNADPFTREANEWLMRTMASECDKPRITAVHAFEDCSLLQFQKAKRLGKACIYDMPIAYYASWQRIQPELNAKYRDWNRTGSMQHASNQHLKHSEMVLADVVLTPSRFAADTIREFHPGKQIVLTPYGVDLSAWKARDDNNPPRELLNFLFVGHCSLRKGVPLLIEAWRAAALRNARLRLVGSWQLAEEKKRDLPQGCRWQGPVSTVELRGCYHDANVFVFPSNFEGWGLVVVEALASGLPVVTTDARGSDDAIDDTCGRLVPADNLEALVESFRWFEQNRDRLAGLKRAARARAEMCTWANYRRKVAEAVRPFL